MAKSKTWARQIAEANEWRDNWKTEIEEALPDIEPILARRKGRKGVRFLYQALEDLKSNAESGTGLPNYDETTPSILKDGAARAFLDYH
ncbi:hypothetical protein QQZ08_002395 [Neonectria magnoliae]|uniref:Uncharacterized protein n=1 Tax=Neonectria magnoliae TaxID=2732573 RepID=A0ABR1ICY1_9HYPO